MKEKIEKIYSFAIYVTILSAIIATIVLLALGFVNLVIGQSI